MKVEPSKLSQLVIAYHARFGRHVPEPTLRRVDAGALGGPYFKTRSPAVFRSRRLTGAGSCRESYRRGGCIVRFENPERATPKRGPDGRWRK